MQTINDAGLNPLIPSCSISYSTRVRRDFINLPNKIQKYYYLNLINKYINDFKKSRLSLEFKNYSNVKDVFSREIDIYDEGILAIKIIAIILKDYRYGYDYLISFEALTITTDYQVLMILKKAGL